MKTTIWSITIAMFAFAGCGGDENGGDDTGPSEREDVARYLDGLEPATLETEEDLVRFSTASAASVFGVGYFGVAARDAVAEAEAGGDLMSACPSVEVKGVDVTITGDCIDPDGIEWSGFARLTGIDSDIEGMIEYDHFGVIGATGDCGRGLDEFPRTGEMSFTNEGDGRYSFGLWMLRQEESATPCGDPVWNAWEYDGTMERTGQDLDGDGDLDGQRFDGSGRIGSGDHGFVSATTENEVIASEQCSTEAASGTTTLETGARTAVITYDGATDCDESSTVTWTLDDLPRGEASGVRCTSTPAPSGGIPTALLGVGIALVAAFARRRG